MGPVRVFEMPKYDQIESLRIQSSNTEQEGWRVQMRKQFRYHKPDLVYEAVVEQIVRCDTTWIDIGGGKTVFPKNPILSRQLSERCKLLVGLDPSDNIHQNTNVHRREQMILEDLQTNRKFDLATFRMVAEHVADPQSFVGALSRLVSPGGYVVLLTPFRWSPVPIVTSLIPNTLHARVIRVFSVDPDRLEEDVFPTTYLMNTRKKLFRYFHASGFDEVAYEQIADCTIIQRFRWSCYLNLVFYKSLKKLGIPYPERNIVAVYRRR